MIVKFIECISISGKKDLFSKAQEDWKLISQCDSFILQYERNKR